MQIVLRGLTAGESEIAWSFAAQSREIPLQADVGVGASGEPPMSPAAPS